MARYRMAGWLAAVAVALSATAVQAQPVALDSLLRDVNSKVPAPPPEMIADLLKDGFTKTRQTRPDVCMPASFAVFDVRPATADALVQNGIAAGQVKNAWTAQVVMTGCALSDARYLVIRLNPDVNNRPVFREIIYARGSTHAGFSVSRDAMVPAIGAATAALASLHALDAGGACMARWVDGSREITDDSKVGPDYFGVRYTGEWDERWHIQACGHQIVIPIHFRADGSGGAYFNVEAGKVIVL